MYVLLNTLKTAVTRRLRFSAIELKFDRCRIEGAHDVMLVIAAPNRTKLAERMVRALAQVTSMTEDLTLLPVEFGYLQPAMACHKG